MWDGSHIPNRRDLESSRGECPYGRLTPGSGSLDIYIYASESEIMGFFRRFKCRHLCGIRRILTASFKAHLPRTRPGYRVTILICERHNHIVKRGFNVRLTVGFNDNFLFPDGASTCSRFLLSFSHDLMDQTLSASYLLRRPDGIKQMNNDYLRGAFFLPATVFLRPFRVRALVCVF